MISKGRKIVIINQAINYLTVGLCNEFAKKFKKVSVITGNVHEQGEALNKNIEITYINKWKEKNGVRKVFIYLEALIKIFFLLITKYRNYEVFFVSVPPMAYLLNLVVKNRFSMLIWDVYPNTFKITGMNENHPVYKSWSYLNKISFKKAYKIFTISEKMLNLLSAYTSREIYVQPIWSIFQENLKVSKNNNKFLKTHNIKDKFIVQYSGNIGITHNVEILIRIAEELKNNKRILFQIIGRGPRKGILKQQVENKKLSNIMFLPFQSDDMFPFSLSAADIGVVILDEKVSKGSVPSKSYNLMSYAIPSLYISSKDSQLFDYIQEYGHGVCYTKSEISNIIDFLEKVSNDKNYYDKLSKNSLIASKNFRRENAFKFVQLYLS